MFWSCAGVLWWERNGLRLTNWEDLMKKTAIALSVLAVIATATVGVVSAQDKAAEKKLVIGEVIELSTFAMKDEGEDLVEATRSRIEQGFPAAILEDETGDVYVAVYKNPAPASKLERGNDHLLEYVGKKVVANGLLYERNGVKVIRMSLVSEY